ncbi:hypothetical protein [Spirosoma fluviale]|uniref:Uncharacterized protein n=1 Tax=Spirosoma fluviale TaxID=1597977 RepID=A0A286GW05_9BACT|nr:hypothetical protein [Spirosoma fluviale]SOD99718.1 hypothetical protein SAMN06269250_0127 [Spirosoma fluviale]
MKREILTTPLKRLRPVYSSVGENIKRYEQVRGLFTPEHSYLFAEPLVTGPARDHLTWFGDYPGQYRTLASLSATERAQMLPVFNEQVNHLFRDIIKYVKRNPGQYDRTQYLTLRRTVESFLEVPSEEHILLFDTPAGPCFVLTNWGFTLDEDNAPHDLIRGLTPFAVTPVVLQATYLSSNMAALNEPLTIEWEGRQLQATTDASGTVTLPEVPYLSEVTVYQIDANGQKANVQQVLVDEREPSVPYPVKLNRLPFPMRFKVINQQGKVVPNHPVRLAYQGLSVLGVSDGNGYLVRDDVFYGEAVQCYDDKVPNAPLAQSHTFSRAQAEYLIPVVIPDPLKPVKRGLGCLGLLGLLLLLLLAGGVAYYFFQKHEKPIISEKSILEEPKENFSVSLSACNGGQTGSNPEYTTTKIMVVTAEYDLVKEEGQFVFDYYTDSYPDKLEVFDGRAEDLDEDSKPLFTYFGSTIYDFKTLDQIHETIKLKSRYITVRATGQSVWDYKVNCPD